ncbi:hypothetical protein RRG08_056169 [Elysia crispata]|uniref:Uncharacterized protein n=1 Tax=Elysia crispata TaxID=231223 RepID=A0AAE0Z0V7_9GAST|nr:hypothetical protein RRG08_056169 [Elysia crispata]
MNPDLVIPDSFRYVFKKYVSRLLAPGHWLRVLARHLICWDLPSRDGHELLLVSGLKDPMSCFDHRFHAGPKERFECPTRQLASLD